MSRESIDLRLFNAGLISNPDQEDIPNEAQTEGSQNLDVETAGKLKGVPMQSTHNGAYGNNGELFGWIERVDGSNTYWDLVYTDGTDTKVITDFYGTIGETEPSDLSTEVAKVIIPNNQEVHIGMGRDNASKWVGYISHGQFGEDASTALHVGEAKLYAPGEYIDYDIEGALGSTVTAGEGAFPGHMSFQYGISFTYDGYQESPIGETLDRVKTTAYDYDEVTVSVEITRASQFSPRITAVNLYRRDMQYFLEIDKPTGLSYYKSSEYGQFKLIESIDINDTWTGTSARTIDITDENSPGATYEQRTGIEETVLGGYYGLDYGIGTTSNNYLFVGNAACNDLPSEDAAHMLFRSKAYRYDMFDWANDKLILPTIPKAMKAHRGKLYVWDENTTYIIDPNAFQIEKTIIGRGCLSQKSVVECDYGLFWANENGVYWSEITENLLKPVQDNLSEPIKSQYQTAVSGKTPILTYNSPRNQLLVHVGDGNIFAYNTVERRWDYYDLSTSTGAFIGKDGETYIATSSSGILKDFGSATRKSWTFISKEFNLDDPSQEKKFYKILRDTSGAVGIYYSIDEGDTWTLQSNEQFLARAASIMVKAIGTGNSSTLDSISILYRRLRGKR